MWSFQLSKTEPLCPTTVTPSSCILYYSVNYLSLGRSVMKIETLGSHPCCIQLKLSLLTRLHHENFLNGTTITWDKNILRCSCWSKKEDLIYLSPLLCSSAPAAAPLFNAMMAMAACRNRSLWPPSMCSQKHAQPQGYLDVAHSVEWAQEKLTPPLDPMSSGRGLRHLTNYSSFIFPFFYLHLLDLETIVFKFSFVTHPILGHKLFQLSFSFFIVDYLSPILVAISRKGIFSTVKEYW